MKNKHNKVKSDKKGIWAILKEFMTSDCNLGCAYCGKNQSSKNQHNKASKNPAKNKERA